MAEMTVYGAPVVSIPSEVFCPACHGKNNVEKVYEAVCILENAEMKSSLKNEDNIIQNFDEVKAVAARLLSSSSRVPVLSCEFCNADIAIKTKVSQRVYSVPAQRICSCGSISDLRFSRDADRVKIMSGWPYLPFLYCRVCKQKLVIPVLGWNGWRNWVVKARRFFLMQKGDKL